MATKAPVPKAVRERLVRTVLPALTYLRSEAAKVDALGVDLDVARRLWIERLTGTRESGALSVFHATLTEGQAPSLPRLREAQQNLDDLIADLRRSPEAMGVRLIGRES